MPHILPLRIGKVEKYQKIRYTCCLLNALLLLVSFDLEKSQKLLR